MPATEFAVVGAGPNGLTAAARLASAGRSVVVLEQARTVGGGTRTEQLTVPGFWHDVCAAVHPTGVASPAFAELNLNIDWIQIDEIHTRCNVCIGESEEDTVI